MGMSAELIVPVVRSAAVCTVGLVAVLFAVKVIHRQLLQAAGVRRALYTSAVAEMTTHDYAPKGDLQAWAKDPVFLEVLFEFIAAIDGDHRETLVRLSEGLALPSRLEHVLTRSFSPAARTAAINRMVSLRLERFVPSYYRALSDTVPEVRLAAARGLAEADVVAFIPRLLDLIDQEAPWEAARLADALALFGRAATDDIARRLRNTTTSRASTALLIRVLGYIGAPESEDVLVELLSSPEPLVRLRAAASLGTAGSPQAVPALVHTLKDPDWRVRVRVAAALGELSEPASVPALVAAVDDDNWWVRQNAARSLSRTPAGIAALVQLSSLPKSKEVALQILGEAGLLSAARARAGRGAATPLDLTILEKMDSVLEGSLNRPSENSQNGRFQESSLESSAKAPLLQRTG